MDLKQEIIRNVKRTGLNAEDEKSLIQEIEEICAFEDSLDEQPTNPARNLPKKHNPAKKQ